MKFIVLALLSLVSIALAVQNPSAASLFENDNQVLKLALTLENFDSAYYAKYLEGALAFTRDNFTAAGHAAAYDLFVTLLGNERAHVSALNSVLQQRNGTTVPVCTYKFPTTTTVNDFIFYSKFFENVGTAAYDGAIQYVYNKTLQTSAATIATVEGRHAAYLNTLNTTIPAGFTLSNGVNVTFPFPLNVDLAFTAATVGAIITPYLTCPYTIPTSQAIAVVIPVAANATAQPANPSAYAAVANDVNALNFALTLELLEATFYNRYLDDVNYNDTAFNLAGYASNVRPYLEVIRAHENFHVTYLRTAIQSLGFAPVVNCTYNFPVNNVTTFIATAALLENTGVSAYDGAVNTINNPTLRQAAAQIATVEARHAAYLNLISGTVPFNAATDTPLSPADVLTAVTVNLQSNNLPLAQFCPQVTVPVVLPIYPYSNSSTGATTGASTGSTTGATTGATGATGGSTTASTGATGAGLTSTTGNGVNSASACVVAIATLLISIVAMLL